MKDRHADERERLAQRVGRAEPTSALRLPRWRRIYRAECTGKLEQFQTLIIAGQSENPNDEVASTSPYWFFNELAIRTGHPQLTAPH